MNCRTRGQWLYTSSTNVNRVAELFYKPSLQRVDRSRSELSILVEKSSDVRQGGRASDYLLLAVSLERARLPILSIIELLIIRYNDISATAEIGKQFSSAEIWLLMNDTQIRKINNVFVCPIVHDWILFVVRILFSTGAHFGKSSTLWETTHEWWTSRHQW